MKKSIQDQANDFVGRLVGKKSAKVPTKQEYQRRLDDEVGVAAGPQKGKKGVGAAVAAAARHPRVRAAARGAARGAVEGAVAGKGKKTPKRS